MIKDLNLDEVLFLDLETVPAEADISQLTDEWKNLWEEKSRFIREKNQSSLEESYSSAGIFAEFGKIICIGLGYFAQRQGERIFRVRSIEGDDEKKVLQEFANLLESHTGKPFRLLCAHNGKEFDFPYLCRRMLVHGIQLPQLLNIAGKKPWEVAHLDTMELWKFGDYKNYTSLKLLAQLFSIPTPKDDISGADVYNVYYKEQNIDRIATYCRKDVITMARVMQKFMGMSAIDDSQVVVL
ncbi:MAG: 3'-5' exonuclease [Flavobacteriales bacterium]